MKVYTIQRELWVPHPLSAVFDFFSRAENLEQITPPWLRFRILTSLPVQMRPGATIRYSLRVRGIPLQWLTEIGRWNPPYDFVDVQIRGPYARWRHTHTFSERDSGTRIVDKVEYALPFGWLGWLIHWLQVGRDVSAIFDYRALRVQELLPSRLEDTASARLRSAS